MPVAITLLIAALVIGASTWKTLIIAILSSASYFPDFPFWPLWLPLGILVGGYLLYFLLGAGLRRSIGSVHVVMVAALFLMVLVARLGAGHGGAPASDPEGAERTQPSSLMIRAAIRLKSALDREATVSDTQTYPTDVKELEYLLREGKSLPRSGFRSHGVRAAVLLRVICGVDGPVLQVRPGDRAGTIYYAVNEDASRYWISMVVLEEFPAGRPAILRGTDGQPMVLAAGVRLVQDDE